MCMSLLCFLAGQKSGTPTCVDQNFKERSLREDAQKALDAIGSTHKLSASYQRAGRGQHVFNNGLLGFHRSVLQDLLREVGGYDEQLENLMQDLIIPLNRTVQNAISTKMVARFSSDEPYVDFNADLFGEFVRELRRALVNYLKAKTSDNPNERIWEFRQRVLLISTEMANREVYVDPMARDRWLQENRRDEDVQLYNEVRRALKIMFRDILQDFQKVSDKISVFRKRNNWSWD
ncbi:hypothetical protein ROHU_000922 [Labeo rohita]|uniref:Uncharacterized protein n=1 Tax=Labeo rohita TaxID=84645 RepID=A0A498P368_LABRO|nr:hypothetical protein ROHU_000922 [Labeo rohita]